MHCSGSIRPMACIMLLILVSCHKKDTATPQEQVLYETDFDQDDGHWFLGESAYGSGTIQNGHYYITNKDASQSYISYTNYAFFNNLTADRALEIKIAVSAGGNNDQAFGGLAWHVNLSNIREKKVFGFYNNGYYEIFAYDGNSHYSAIQASTFSSAVHKNGENVLRITLASGNLHFSINGTEVYSTPSNGESLDYSGFFMDGGCAVTADYFKAFLP